MKRTIYLLLLPTIILAACGGGDKKNKIDEELTKLKSERAALDEKIAKLETEANKDKPAKAISVSVMEMQPQAFNAFVEIQARVNGEQSVLATPQAAGIVEKILVRPGQHVSKGQTLAVLDAAAIEQQIKSIDAQVDLTKAIYEKQQKLWAQNIGSEVQLLSAKASYEATAKQKAALVAQRNMYSIKSPINGTVDQVDIKEGEMAAIGMLGIRVVNMDALKIQANLGENYLGKVKEGDGVNLVFAEGDTIKSKLSYVSQAVDPVSRAFQVEVRLGSNNKLHPNMSCKMQIVNYKSGNALIVPVYVIQKTSEGEKLFVAEGNKAKAVIVKSGRNSNGLVEILSGLKTGDKVITAGYADLDNGDAISVQ
ncbi:MAG: efflux RND transporter periplasmic adaptor subunit [Bacteroidetes bacterium]|nr:efflux RND transporter periplasmic adaptor subunit [Bacteroidota bacterium]